MSGSYVNTNGSSEQLNAGAAHDTGLYDPAVHDNQIVALYSTNADAHAARDTLLAAGVSSSQMQVVDQGAAGTDASSGTPVEDQGFWSAVKSLFVPDEDLSHYNHALQRGHAMLVVTPGGGMDRSHLIHTLESTNPVDFDAKLEEWRQSGYDYSGRSSSDSSVGAAAGMASGTSAVGADYPGSTAPLVAAASTNIAPATSAAPAGSAATVGYTAPAAATARTDVDSPDTIKVVEERLRVGKREVAEGAVRVRSYVVERPVEEQVHLHEEHIHLERRPVDRAATPGDTAAFQERTIEARATSEEAVVSKTARVVEEIGLTKEATDRTETVRDTVRHTEVDVEDTTGTTARPTPVTPGSLGTGGTTTNATPDAGTSGANSPRK